MRKLILIVLTLFSSVCAQGQRTETVFLTKSDSISNLYVAIFPKGEVVKSFMVLLDGFGNGVGTALQQTDLPQVAAQNGILTIMPVLKTGANYWGSDSASQASLREIIEFVVKKYQIQGKDFYLGGFSIGGTCAVKYAELSVQENFSIKPTAVFAINPILDWERYYNGAKRVVRISGNTKVNDEVFYMLGRIEKEMRGTPSSAREHYYAQSPYSFSDTTQKAIKNLVGIPVMIISEPDVEWYLTERNYDLSYNNITDHTAMINELKRLGNQNAVLVTTTNRGYRKPNHQRHPNSWSIVDPKDLIEWLKTR